MNLSCLPLNLLWVAMTSEVADSSLYRLAALLLEKHCLRYQILNLSISIQIQFKILHNDILHFQRDGVYQNFAVSVRNKL